MQGPSFISGRAAVISYLGEGGGGGSLVIKTALEIHREPATMGKQAGALCVCECGNTHGKMFKLLSLLFKSDRSLGSRNEAINYFVRFL